VNPDDDVKKPEPKKMLLLRPGKEFESYSSAATGRGWRPGEVREVPESVATYLMSTFPESFVEHGGSAAGSAGRPMPSKADVLGKIDKADHKESTRKPSKG